MNHHLPTPSDRTAGDSSPSSEPHRAALEAQLRHAYKLGALGALAGGIAHDFNNILTAILVNQELALMAIGDDEELRARLNDIGRASLRAKELVGQILAFSHYRAARTRTEQPLGPIVEEAMALVRASIPASIEITVQNAPDCPPVLADATEIHQIVLNLCANAEYAMRGRPGKLLVALGPIAISADDCRYHPELLPGPHARLVVSDTGTGMSQDTLARIFDPFFTTKPLGEGTGLGLSIIHGIVREHGGAIRVRSQPNLGTTFELLFPAATPPRTGVDAPGSSVVRGCGERLMIVDDEEAIGRGLELLLTRFGYRVTAFADPSIALGAFKATPDAFDLVLVDMTMPRMTGIELMQQLRQERPDIPGILMSGGGGPGTASAPMQWEFIEKPIELTTLSQALRRALSR